MGDPFTASLRDAASVARFDVNQTFPLGRNSPGKGWLRQNGLAMITPSRWDGEGLLSGIYFCRLECPTGLLTIKMILLK